MHATLKELEKHGIVVNSNAKLRSGVLQFVDMHFVSGNVKYTIYKDCVRRAYTINGIHVNNRILISKDDYYYKDVKDAYNAILKYALTWRKTHNVM